MAMRGSSSGGISAGSRPQQPARLQTQTFRPKSEWKHEEASSFLFIYLPGFAVEQLTVTPDYSNRLVYVQGQRRLPNNRILPVNEAFTIPEDFDLSKMDKQFGRGILMLKMPRKPPPPPEDQITEITPDSTSKPQQTPDAVSLARDDDSITINPPKGTSTTLIADAAAEKSIALDVRSSEPQQTPDAVSLARDDDSISIGPPKGISTTLITDTAAEKSTTLDVVKSDREELVEKKEENDGNGNGRSSDPDREKESKESAAMADVVEKKEKVKSLKSVDESVYTNGKEIKKEMEKKSMVVNELNEDRKLVVNMGAAVLIIVGLGVSIFYKLRSLA